MGLNEESKQLLSNEIDEAIHGLPSSMAMARESAMREVFRIENYGGFAIGYAFGQIIRLMQMDITQRYGRKPNEEENQEISDMIWSKVDDFRHVVRKWKRKREMEKLEDLFIDANKVAILIIKINITIHTIPLTISSFIPHLLWMLAIWNKFFF